MRWESLVSTQNLKLAWRRINTGRNLQYKRFFREFYYVYESALDDNIRDLHNRLLVKAWKPNHAVRIYLPKSSGLQRPISLLGVEDQIVLQAIANTFARKLRAKRKQVELRTVFSNKLVEPSESIFFTERWQQTYQAFQKKCSEYFHQGYRWAADFDLAAYYDTISHNLLTRVVSPRDAHPETWGAVHDWLKKWSAADSDAMTGHGIPQGPVSSDFLAEAFFLPIDLRLYKDGCTYIRYVDDIRLFGKTRNEVRQLAVKLEQQCRNRGLIPQKGKFDPSRELRSPADAMGSLPSIPPTAKEDFEPEMSDSEALDILKSAIGGKPAKIKDKSRFRYVMFRAPANTKFLNTVIKLLPAHPEHIDAFVAYFGNFRARRSISRAAIGYLESGLPYSYVRGELWHVIARMGNRDELKRALPLARKDARRRRDCLVLSWGVMHFLIRCQDETLARLGERLASELPLSRALLGPALPARAFPASGLAKVMLKGSLEEQLAAARELQHRNVSLNELGLRPRDVPPICQNSLRSLGVIRRRQRQQDDWINQRLISLYGCTDMPIWRTLLGSEYEHALQILIEGEVLFAGARSEWLALQDSFNDITIRQFFGFLAANSMPGHSKLTGGGKLVKYGNLIAVNSPFDKHYSNEAKLLRNIHVRRNQIPGSHPYDEKGGAQNRWLKKKERDSLAKDAKVVLNLIAAAVKRIAK